MHFTQTLSNVCQIRVSFLTHKAKSSWNLQGIPSPLGALRSALWLSLTHITIFKPMPLHLAFDWSVSLRIGGRFFWTAHSVHHTYTYGKLTRQCFKHQTTHTSPSDSMGVMYLYVVGFGQGIDPMKLLSPSPVKNRTPAGTLQSTHTYNNLNQ